MAVFVGKPGPEVRVDAWVRGSHGPRDMSLLDHRGKWVVLFFYPRDFTFICPTEIAAFAARQQDFAREDAVVIGASTDSFYSHNAWFESDPRLTVVNYPVIADTSHELARQFGVLLEDGTALRGTFIVDPDGIVRHISVNELQVGRSVDETLRVLQALRTGELCPVEWRPGRPTLTSYDAWLAKAFPRLPEKALADATQRSQTVRFPAGATVIREGDAPDRFYVIAKGEAEVLKRRPGGAETTLALLGPGEFFGEIGLLTEARRTASVRARSELELLALDWEDFRRLVEASEPTAKDFTEIVRERLAKTEGLGTPA